MIELPNGQIWELPGVRDKVKGDPSGRPKEPMKVLCERMLAVLNERPPLRYKVNDRGLHKWLPKHPTELFKAVSVAYLWAPCFEAFLMPWGQVYMVWQDYEMYPEGMTKAKAFGDLEEYRMAFEFSPSAHP